MLSSTRRATRLANKVARSSTSKPAVAALASVRALSTTSARAQLVGGPKPSPLVGGNPLSGQPKRTAPAPRELLTVLEETIKTHGPLPVSRYMTLCLAHPTFGYYTTRTVFGKQGDFVTSPEISQIFGELLAIWYVTQWAQQGAPSKVRIVELGPGRGTLLADILRTFRSLPPSSSPPVTSIHLVESSPHLREVQRKKLAETGFGGVETRWWGNVSEVPKSEDEFTVVVAHEFFDAMPIHIFENTPNGWREVLVDIADPKAVIVPGAKPEPLRLVLAPNPTPASTLYTRIAEHTTQEALTKPNLASALSFDSTLPPQSPGAPGSAVPPSPPPAHAAATSAASEDVSPTLARFARLPQGSRMEISPASWEVAKGLGELLSGPKGGAGLVVDYGDAKAFGRSWRGFRKHEVVDPLSEPGHTDLTANVDFAYLAEALAESTHTHGPLTQSTFLHSLGLLPRLDGLLRKAPADRQKEIKSAAERLVDKLGMGTQYKVMAVTPKSVPVGEAFPFVAGIEEAAAKAAGPTKAEEGSAAAKTTVR